METHPWDHDCIVVGGGPAGLTAAIYLARFHLAVAVFDDRRSRAELIPLARNHAGYPVGVSGRDLLRRMRFQAESFGAVVLPLHVEAVERREHGFVVTAEAARFHAARVLLATGVINLPPGMSHQDHDDALRRGLLRYCPICDGYEVTDHNVALLGSGEHAIAEAEFLRSYTARVSLLAPHGPHRFSDAQRDRIAAWNIVAIDGPVTGITPGPAQISLAADGETLGFDTLYSALGTEVRSELARGAGALTSADGAVLVDRHQMTSLEGLYAAGDVVKGLDQISAAMGQAGIAATAMRNAICAARPLRRGG